MRNLCYCMESCVKAKEKQNDQSWGIKTLKSNFKWPCVKPKDLKNLAADRETWRSLTNSGAAAFEKDRQHHLQAARDKCHRVALSQVYTQDHQCPTCERCYASVYALRSHMRSHRWGWHNNLSLYWTQWTTNSWNVQSQNFIKWIDDTSFNWINQAINNINSINIINNSNNLVLHRGRDSSPLKAVLVYLALIFNTRTFIHLFVRLTLFVCIWYLVDKISA